MNDYLIEIFARVLMILLILPLHELAHGFIAHKMGDDTAELSGRITLNPLAHVDLVGSLLLVFTGFGWAKPVPVNPHRMKSPRKGMALTALAGPVSNLLAALLIRIICEVAFCFKGVYYSDNMTVSTVLMLLVFMYQINIHLAVFNLIPVPPLDGSKILFAILPDRIYWKIMQYERYLYFGLMFLLFAGSGSRVLSSVVGNVYDVFLKIASLPFEIFI